MIDRNAGLVEQTRQLLDPGEIDLAGLIVHTDLSPSEELEVHDLTVQIGDVIAGHLMDEPTYVYSGNDDPRFASTQHQGLTVADDDFVWECQHVLDDGTFAVVFYYERGPAHETIVDELRERGYEVTGVTV